MREALSLAIDRDIIVNNDPRGRPGAGLHADPLRPPPAGRRPRCAAADMTQEERNAARPGADGRGGLRHGRRAAVAVEILYNTSEAHQQLAVAIGQMWKQTLGIDTTLANQEWQTFLDARKTGDFELARAGWCADYNEASSFLDILTSNSDANDSKYRNPEFDALMDESRTAEPTRCRIYQQAEEMLGARRADPAHLLLRLELHAERRRSRAAPLENAQQNWYAKDLYRVAAE